MKNPPNLHWQAVDKLPLPKTDSTVYYRKNGRVPILMAWGVRNERLYVIYHNPEDLNTVFTDDEAKIFHIDLQCNNLTDKEYCRGWSTTYSFWLNTEKGIIELKEGGSDYQYETYEEAIQKAMDESLRRERYELLSSISNNFEFTSDYDIQSIWVDYQALLNADNITQEQKNIMSGAGILLKDFYDAYMKSIENPIEIVDRSNEIGLGYTKERDPEYVQPDEDTQKPSGEVTFFDKIRNTITKSFLVVSIVASAILFPACTSKPKPIMERAVVDRYRIIHGIDIHNETRLQCIEHGLPSYCRGIIGHLGDTLTVDVSDSHF